MFQWSLPQIHWSLERVRQCLLSQVKPWWLKLQVKMLWRSSVLKWEGENISIPCDRNRVKTWWSLDGKRCPYYGRLGLRGLKFCTCGTWLCKWIQIRYLGRLMEACFNEPWLITLSSWSIPRRPQTTCRLFFKKPCYIYILNLLHIIKTTGGSWFAEFWFTRALYIWRLSIN